MSDFIYEDQNDHKGWVCPKCGRVLAPDMKVCPYCGVGISVTTEGLQPGEQMICDSNIPGC